MKGAQRIDVSDDSFNYFFEVAVVFRTRGIMYILLIEGPHEVFELRSRGSREGEEKFSLFKEVVLVSDNRSQYFDFTNVETKWS
jgi:hypothetical protein